MHRPDFRLDDLFDRDFGDRLSCWLKLCEICSLECTSRCNREALRQGSLWERTACRDFLPKLRVPCPSPSTPETKKAVREMIAHLRTAKISRDKRAVALSTFGVAQELAECSARARRVAARHRAEFGAFAEIVIANFRFGKGATLDGTCLHSSSSIVTTLRLDGVRQVWELKLALQSGAVLLGSKLRSKSEPPAVVGQDSTSQGHPTSDGMDQAFLADIHCVSDAFKLHLFDMLVHPMSGWVRGNGLVSACNKGKVDPSSALRQGLLCVLCLRGVPSSQAMARPYRSLNAMNLDVPSGAVY